MKKIILNIFAFVFVFLGFSGAELYKPHRIFEIGSDTEFALANSHFKLGDFMVKDLVIDIREWYEAMPENGLSFAAHLKEKSFININANSHFRLGFFAGAEVNGFSNLDKEFFRILAKGTELDENETFELNVYGDAFFDAGFSFQTLIRNIGLTVSPSIYVPLAYLEPTTAKAHFETSSDGKISIEAKAPLNVYTAFDMEKIIGDDDSDENSGDSKSDIEAAKLLQNAGFDISFEVEKNILYGLNASVFGRIPVLPGKLKYKMSTSLNAYFYEDNALGILNDLEAHDWDFNKDDLEYSDADKKVFRPLKLGLQASYRPFGSLITLRPKANIVVRDPYSSDRIFWPEYDLTAELSLFNILGISVGTGYEYRTFTQHLGFMLNLRLVEILAKISLASTDFAASLRYAGVGGFVGVRIGL